MRNKLRIGVLLDNYFLPAWEYKIIEEIKNSYYAHIVLIVKNKANNVATKNSNINSGSIVFRLHQKLDRLIFTHKNFYSEKKDIYKLLKEVPEVLVKPVEDRIITRFNTEDLIEIEKNNLDIILKFGFNKLFGNILKIPKYGVWSFPVVDYNIKNGVTPGYFEVVNKHPVTNTKLVILKEDPIKDIMIHSSWESTCAYSISLNANKILWRASSFIPMIMNGIYRFGDNYLNKLSGKCKDEERPAFIEHSSAPSLIPAAFNFLSSFLVLSRQILKKIFYTDNFSWILLFKINGNTDFFHNSFISYKKLQSANDKFWADPFIICKNDRYFVFVEELIYKTNRGHISVLELNEKGDFISSKRVIERPYHMSYPFIFELHNTYYMIPETSENKTIDLYKCTGFPDKWEVAKNIMHNLNAVDTTLFFYMSKWWLFTSIDNTNNISGYDTELYLFFSDDIFTDNWQSHPNNPIVSDARRARSAGAIFVQDDKIYRPSQDCSGRYGNAFNINQILTLNETEYEETRVLKVEPSWDNKLKGAHTFNFDKNFTVIDAYTYRSRIPSI